MYKNVQKACGISNCVANRTSKMAAGGHFEKIQKKRKLCIDLKWREMRSKVIFGHPKWPKSDFQNGRRQPF